MRYDDEVLVTYEVADDNLALSVACHGLCRSLLGSSGASLPRILLDTTDGGGGGRTSGRAALAPATAVSSTSLSREDLVKGLVKLARHIESSCRYGK